MKKHMKYRYAALSVLIFLLVTTAAIAEEQSGDVVQLETMVVTAHKSEEDNRIYRQVSRCSTI